MKQNLMYNFMFIFLLKGQVFCRGRWDRTQRTSSVTQLIFRRTTFPFYTLTTFIVQNVYKMWINHVLLASEEDIELI